MLRYFLFAVLFPVCCNAQSIQNLDVKNGFLQFHLGDSIAAYKNDIYVAQKNHLNENEVRPDAIALHKYLDKVTLVSENGILTEIDLMVRQEKGEVYMDKALANAYGRGTQIPNLDKFQPGTHITVTTWTGERVTAMLIQTNINRYVNKYLTRGRLQSIVFKKTSEARVDGALPLGFGL